MGHRVAVLALHRVHALPWLQQAHSLVVLHVGRVRPTHSAPFDTAKNNHKSVCDSVVCSKDGRDSVECGRDRHDFVECTKNQASFSRVEQGET